MNPEELLLRDIHLPDPVSWWPPAIGWWLVAASLLLTVAGVIWWRRRQNARRRAPETIARRELVRLRTAWTEHGDAQRLIGDLSTWLRRVGMSVSSRQKAASLTGAEWLAYLDEIAGEPVFVSRTAQSLVTAPYERSVHVQPDEVIALCERWLDATTRRRSKAIS